MIATMGRDREIRLDMSWLLSRLYLRSILVWIVASAITALGILGLWAVFRQDIAGAALERCLNSTVATCTNSQLQVLSSFNRVNRRLDEVLLAIPLLMGAFIGAPLMGRELENGTHRLVWTLGITPIQWLLRRAGAAVAFCVALTTGVGLATAAWLALASGVVGPWPQFDGYLPVFVAYVIFAVMLGIVVATIMGRTVPAMAVTCVLWLGMRLAFGILARPMLLPPLVRRGVTAGNSGDWFIGQAYLDSNGHQWSEAQVDRLLQQLGGGGPNLDATLQQHGIFLSALYQPANRFWTFQAIEAGTFLVLSLVCLGIGVAWVRWRLARE